MAARIDNSPVKELKDIHFCCEPRPIASAWPECLQALALSADMDELVDVIVCFKCIETDHRPSDVVSYDTTLGYVQNLTWWGCDDDRVTFGG
jgi:hypothetical protein